IGNLTHPERGFSGFDFIPNTDDQIIVALNTEEVGKLPTKSYVTVFDIEGHIILDDQQLDGDFKFEGLKDNFDDLKILLIN
ncbi:hypothetical protein DICVIV_14505, partial [Dictyocaulus viviparus]